MPPGSSGSATMIVFLDWQTPRISLLYMLWKQNVIGVVFNSTVCTTGHETAYANMYVHDSYMNIYGRDCNSVSFHQIWESSCSIRLMSLASDAASYSASNLRRRLRKMSLVSFIICSMCPSAYCRWAAGSSVGARSSMVPKLPKSWIRYFVHSALVVSFKAVLVVFIDCYWAPQTRCYVKGKVTHLPSQSKYAT